MRRRVIGHETEYGCVVTGEHASIGHSTILERMFAYGKSQGTHPQWQVNGHRFYLDIGAHPENATAECTHPWDVTHHALAGDRNLRDLAAAYEQYLTEIEVNVRINLYKNNICNYGEGAVSERGFGSHENYQVQAQPDTQLATYAPKLLAYIATRQLVLGAGRLQFDDRGQPQFELGQRSAFMNKEVDSGTTNGHRPLVNLRDEAHAKGSKRLHLISADNNILPQNTALKFGFMSALLTMIEEGRAGNLPELQDAVKVVRDMSQYPARRWPLKGSGSRTGLDIQQMYFDVIWDFISTQDDMKEQQSFVAEYGSHLDRLRRSYHRRTRSYAAEDHYGKLDWATKEYALRQVMEREPLKWTPAVLRRLELSLHDISNPGSLMYRLHRSHGLQDDEAVQQARTTPPTDTRAHVRGWMAARSDAENFNWTGFKYNGENYHLYEPLDATFPEGLQHMEVSAA